MSLSPGMIDAMVAAGLTLEQMATLVKASLAADETKRAVKRAKDADRQRRSRSARASAASHSSQDVTVTPRDTADIADVTENEPATESNSSRPEQKNLPQKDPKGSQKPPSDFPSDAFERWWALYPRKTAKDDARRAFDRMRRAAQVTFASLMSVTAQFARAPPEPRFIPYPATWLNRGQFHDEPSNIETFPGRPAGPQPRRSAGDVALAGVVAAFGDCDLGGAGRRADLEPRPDDPGVIDAEYSAAARH